MGRIDIRKKMEARRLAAATIISHKQKKKLEKIVLRKKLKSNRTELIKDLKKYQLQPEQQNQLHSTSYMQTKGLKRFTQDQEFKSSLEHSRIEEGLKESRIDAATLYKRKKRKNDLNISTIKKSSSESEDTDQISSDAESNNSSDTEIYDFKDETTYCAPTFKPTINQFKPKKALEKTNQTSVHSSKQDAEQHDLTKEVKKAVYVETYRDPAIVKSRYQLPIIGEEQRIMEEITYNDVVVISGETGSGKTTQLPQFLYEAGYALGGKMIGITEPRRVAAVSMCNRVAQELNLLDGEVSYQIRFSGDVSDKTRIKFMTDGILLKECQKDFLLSKYSAIIIDEAHERSVFSDILIGLLSRIVPLREKKGNPLKLIIMSATLRVADFTQNNFLFKLPPPVIDIEARQYSVSVQFQRKTPTDWLQAAYKKVCRIHTRLPKGGILIFVTSQQDVRVLCQKLRQRFPMDTSSSCSNVKVKNKKQKSDTILECSKNKPADAKKTHNLNDDLIIDNFKLELLADHEEEENLCSNEDDGLQKNVDKNSLEIDSDDSDDNDSENEVRGDEFGEYQDNHPALYCLGLYAMLPIEKQNLVFLDPPSNARFCVVATNVAETSLTIPNIRYVVDPGKEKTKVYDTVTGISKFETIWTSKASAEQRKGRAGRTGPGHCFRLYSSAVYTNDFPEFAEPQIIKKPIEDLVLQMKSMNIDNVVNFPFPTKPSEEALVSAEKKLILLGALHEKPKSFTNKDLSGVEYCSRPTKLGKAMACFAVGARFAKMLAMSPIDLLPHVIAIVSALTVREMFLNDFDIIIGKDDRKKKRSKWFEIRKAWRGKGDNMRALGDIMLILRAVSEAQKSGCSMEFCQKHGLRSKSMLEIHKLRTQLTNEINSSMKDIDLKLDECNLKIKDDQARILRQLILSSFFDHVARKMPNGYQLSKNDSNFPDDNENSNHKDNLSLNKPLKNAYECLESSRPVFISQESILKVSQPQFVIYKEIYENSDKLYMRDIVAIEPEWLPEYGFKLCRFIDPPGETSLKTTYDSNRDIITCRKSSIYGPLSWSIGPVDVPLHLVEKGREIYKHFGMYLLGGQVVEWFQKYTAKLLSPPSIMIKPWAKLQTRTERLLKALIARDVKTKKQFFRILKDEPEYLKQEYLLWLPESLHFTITQDWEQLVMQA